ncbi:MAG TPA: DUF262 domain-containing HNH endonuclease family protein [Ktedonobacterales bacterium]|nr:DUF262 domain-containing HNH endonuclease family protein [Ktedonobacterales bacterium]
MARIEIRGEQYPVGDIFGDKFAFSIPPYQRPYAWTTEHAGELLDDLLDYLGNSDEAVEDLNPYFLGSIVLIKGERPDAQVVDGHQRLITLTILLAVLRALIPDQFGEGITRRLYEPADPLNDIPARYRISPKERDARFFQEYIQSPDGLRKLREHIPPELPDSQRNMRENALHYLRELAPLSTERRVRLAQFVVRRCLLVVVSTPDLSSAYRIFSILNDRGLDLSSADILKADIIGRIPESAQQTYTARWEDTEELLGREAFDDLLGHIRTIYRKNLQPREAMLDEFRTHVIGVVGDSQRLIDDLVVPYGRAYDVILHASYQHAEGADRVNEPLRWLNRVDHMDWMAPAILYLSLHHDNPERLARFFTELERLAASLMIRRQYAHRRTPRYARLIVAIERGDDLSFPSSPIQLSAEEREATIGALSGDFYLMSPRPRQYALLRLDSSLAGTEAVYNRRTITVEHVLPRNPAQDSEWMRAFPTPEERASHVHRLGNLVLLSGTKNANASNYDFARKKQVYFAARNGVSPFALTTQVLQEEEWTPAVIERRQQELIGRLKQVWRL